MRAPAPSQSYPREFGDYLLLGQLGAGGMGVVYQAVHQTTGRPCALKLIRGSALADGDGGRVQLASLQQRFATEVEATAGLDHPNIVRVRHAGLQDGEYFLELELIEGGTLAERLEAGPLPAEAAAELVLRLARAVQYAHGRGVLHRDLKPGNVLLGKDGEPRLADFGLARGLERTHNLQRTLAALGTPAYLAPEIAQGSATGATIAADTYSLGAILYECLAGRPPFQAANLPALLRKVAEEEPAPLPAACAAAGEAAPPADLVVIAHRAMARDPARRFASAGELADELERFLRREPIQSRPFTPAERFRLWCRRRPRTALAAAAALLASVAALIAIIVLWQQAVRASAEARRKSEALERTVVRDTLKLCSEALAAQDRSLALQRMLEALHQLPETPSFHRWLQYRLAADAFLMEYRTLPHSGSLSAIHLDSPRPRIISAGGGGFWLHDELQGKELLHLPALDASPPGQLSTGRDAWVSADGTRLLAQEASGRLALWDIGDLGAPSLLWTNAGDYPFAVAPNRNAFVVGAPSRPATLAALQRDGLRAGPFLHPPPGVPTAFISLPETTAPVVRLCLNSNGTLVVAALASGEICKLIAGSESWSAMAAWRTNTTLLAVTSDGEFVLAAAGREYAGFRTYDGYRLFLFTNSTPVTALALTSAARRFGLLDLEGLLTIRWRTDGRLCADPMNLHQPPASLRLTPSKRHFVVSGQAGETRIIHVSSGGLVANARQPHQTSDADYDENRRILMTASDDGPARLWSLSRPAPPDNVSTTLPPFSAAFVLPPPPASKAHPGSHPLARPSLLVLTTNRELLAVTPQARDFSLRALGSFAEASALALTSRPEAALLTADRLGRVRRHLLEADGGAADLAALGTAVERLAASADGQQVVVASGTGVVALAVEANASCVRLAVAFTNCTSLVISPQGNYAAAAAEDGALLVLDLASGKSRCLRPAQPETISALAFSPDGSRLAAASRQGCTRVWSSATGEDVIPPFRDLREPASVCWDRAGERLLAGGLGTGVLLDTHSGVESARFTRLPGWNRGVLSQDGETVLFSSSDGKVSLWNATGAARLAEWDLADAGNAAPEIGWAGADGEFFAWNAAGLIRFIRPPPPLAPALRDTLVEWLTGRTVNAQGASVELDPIARAERLARLRAANAGGELPGAYARHLPPAP
jgi:WD40 repeat protein